MGVSVMESHMQPTLRAIGHFEEAFVDNQAGDILDEYFPRGRRVLETDTSTVQSLGREFMDACKRSLNMD